MNSKAKMLTITVRTPFEGKPLKVNWDSGKVRVKGSREALLHWSDLLSEGMYGLYGHMVNFDNTLVTDLVVALQNRVPKGDLSFGPGVREALIKEKRESKPFPKGSVS